MGCGNGQGEYAISVKGVREGFVLVRVCVCVCVCVRERERERE